MKLNKLLLFNGWFGNIKRFEMATNSNLINFNSKLSLKFSGWNFFLTRVQEK